MEPPVETEQSKKDNRPAAVASGRSGDDRSVVAAAVVCGGASAGDAGRQWASERHGWERENSRGGVGWLG